MTDSLKQDRDHVLAHTPALWEPLRGQQIFMTGGTGYVGTWLVESLLWADEHLKLNVKITLLTRNPAGFRRRVPHVAGHPSVQLLEGDACSFEYPEGEFSFVVHGATERTFDATKEQPLATFDRDLQATRHALEFARTHKTRRLLFTSSGAVYGKQPEHLTHIPEDYNGAPFPSDTRSAYGQGKRASEFMCAMYARQYGFDAAIARLFAQVGPYLPLDENYAVGNFIGDILAGRPVRISGDGTTRRSYLYGADLAIWLWTMLIRGESAHPYNVGSGEDLSIAELARLVVEETDCKLPIETAQEPVPGAPPSRYVPSVERAERELGLRPWIGLAEGIRRTYAWNRQVTAMER
ncbi:MAG: NAD-dependent epimerase/dehydratase family protein [Bryobacteraceae bacterium]